MSRCILAAILLQLMWKPHLAVHAISHASMPWYAVSKILDLEAPLEATGKETSKGSNDGGKSCQHHSMKLHASQHR